MPTVDIIIEIEGKIVFIKRNSEPFKDMIAIPGGRVEFGETVEAAAVRESKEETSLKVSLKEILGVYSDPKRDPGGISIGTVFIAEPEEGDLRAGSDAKEIVLLKPEEIEFDKLAFDHKKIIQDYLKWKKKKETYWSTKV
jgi:ADP-ribose pyrophosphatase YjhB (NUDIX family)